jgi:hypothetical protein
MRSRPCEYGWAAGASGRSRAGRSGPSGGRRDDVPLRVPHAAVADSGMDQHHGGTRARNLSVEVHAGNLLRGLLATTAAAKLPRIKPL